MASYTIHGVGTPTITSTRPDGPFALGTEFYVTSKAWATGLRFWRSTTAITATTGRIYSVTTSTTGSAVTGTDVTFTLSGTGWQSATFATPVALTINQRYKTVIQYPNSFPETRSFWAAGGVGSAGLTSGPLVAPNYTNSTGARQSSYIAGAMAYPNAGQETASNDGPNWWADVTVTDVDPSGLLQTQFFQAAL